MDLFWSDSAGRFHDAAGRFVADSRVRAVVDSVADAASARMAVASEALLEGRMSLGAWQVEMRTAIRTSHVAASVLGTGGAESMTFSAWGATGTPIREQYRYLANFAAQIADGSQPLTRGVVSRSAMYGQSSRGAFSRAQGAAMRAAGMMWERNVISSRESCAGCRAESARGLVPIGTLVPVGSRSPCRSNCKCRIVHVRAAEAAA